jgi:hypothetical protein
MLELSIKITKCPPACEILLGLSREGPFAMMHNGNRREGWGASRKELSSRAKKLRVTTGHDGMDGEPAEGKFLKAASYSGRACAVADELSESLLAGW